MGKETESSLELLGQIMEANLAHSQNIVNDLWANDRARAIQISDGVNYWINECNWGGTTAEYESTLERIRRVFYPTEECREHYRKYAKEYIEGTLADRCVPNWYVEKFGSMYGGHL